MREFAQVFPMERGGGGGGGGDAWESSRGFSDFRGRNLIVLPNLSLLNDVF